MNNDDRAFATFMAFLGLIILGLALYGIIGWVIHWWPAIFILIGIPIVIAGIWWAVPRIDKYLSQRFP